MQPSESDDEAVVFSTNAFVRAKGRFSSWRNWNDKLGCGPRVEITDRSVRIRAPQGVMLESRDITVDPQQATMAVDRVGWAGTPLGRRECIRLTLPARWGTAELAISPESDIRHTWVALEAVGVRPLTPSPGA